MTKETAAEDLAKRFHRKYEALAPSFGYTRPVSAKGWDKLPERNKNLMIKVCKQLLKEGLAEIEIM